MGTLAERIREIRGALSRKEFADSLGIHVNTLGRYERGEGEPDASTIAMICDCFGVDPGWLILGKGPKPMDRPLSVFQDKNGAKLYNKEYSFNDLDSEDIDNMVIFYDVVSNLINQLGVPLKKDLIPMVTGSYYNDIKIKLAFLAEELINAHTKNAHVETEEESIKRALTDINLLSGKETIAEQFLL